MIDRIFPEVPRPAVWLGLVGLIPFYAGAIGGWVLPDPLDREAFQLLVYYAGIVLGFLGGVHWGFAAAGFGGPRPVSSGMVSGTGRTDEAPPPTLTWNRLGWSVLPSIIGWLALFLHGQSALVFLMVAYVGMLFGDLRAMETGVAPAWYLNLRRPLTWLVVAALALALARTVVVLGH